MRFRRLSQIGMVSGAFLAFVGCGGDGLTEAECKAVCADAGAGAGADATRVKPEAPPDKGDHGKMTSFERGVVGPVLKDLRAGVRPFNAEGFGVCRGQGRDCDAFMGAKAGELPAGKYMIRAELRVPKEGEWKVDLTVDCTTTRESANGSSTSTNNYNKSYDVTYVGEDRGSRLSPLYKIDSPNPGGARACTYSLTSPHPDGDKVYEGSWSVPAG